jgi:hypothetical protein
MRRGRTIDELEMQLRSELRGHPFYHRIHAVVVSSCLEEVCGWAVQVEGDLSAAEEAVCSEVIREMQNHFDLINDPRNIRV